MFGILVPRGKEVFNCGDRIIDDEKRIAPDAFIRTVVHSKIY